jgi:hypothetical protein
LLVSDRKLPQLLYWRLEKERMMPVFKGPGGYGRIINIIMCTVMCIALSLYVLWTMQNIPGNEGLPIFTVLGFWVSFVMSFCVGYVVGDIIPCITWAQKVASALHIKNQIGVHLIRTLFLAFFLITCVSIACLWMTNIQSLGLETSLMLWTLIYPALLAGGYVVIFAFFPLAALAAAKISGFDPSKMPPSAEPHAANPVE